MALIVADRVFETTTTTGTGALSLAGAVTGFQAFDDVCANNDTAYYSLWAVDGNGNPTGAWETGLGTFTDTDTLTRTTVHASSNAGAAVNLAAGTKYVQLSATASHIKAILGSPQMADQDDYTLTLDDAGRHYYHTSGSTHTLTIPANSSVAFPIGTVIAIVNENGGGALSIAITTDTLRWTDQTGTRSLAANGAATLLKVASTVWRLTGDGIT